MSKSLLITYDLSAPGRDYKGLIKKIKSYNGYARITESSYIITTKKEPEKVRDELLALIDENDKIYVGVITTPAAWFGLPDSVANWLQKYLS